MSFRPENNRKKQFKQGINFDEARRKREENIVEQRRQKKDESLQKKRFADLQQPSTSPLGIKLTDAPLSVTGVTASSSNSTAVGASADVQAGLQALQSLVMDLNSPDVKKQYEALVSFRKLLSVEKSPPINAVVSLGVIPQFIEFLKKSDNTDFQFEAAWALTNVASGESQYTQVVVEQGAVPIFVQILQSPSDDVREQAVWALGNIAGDNTQCRDYVLQCNALQPLVEQLYSSTKVMLLRNATWTLSNLCRGKPQPNFNVVKVAIPYLAKLILLDDDEVLVDACWALSYLSDGEDYRIQEVLDAGVAPRLVQLLGHNQTNVVIPALRNVGNIVTGNDKQTQFIIDSGALQYLLSLLTKQYKKSIKKEACWTISNITAGTLEQAQAVIDAQLIPPLIQLLDNAEFDIQKEAAWAICNATSMKDNNIIKYLVEQNTLRPLCNMLSTYDNKIIVIIIDGLDNILRVGESQRSQHNGINPYVILVEEADGLDKLEALENHQSQEVYQKAVTLIQNYFDVVEEEYDNSRELQDISFVDNSQNPSTSFAGHPEFNFLGQQAQ